MIIVLFIFMIYVFGMILNYSMTFAYLQRTVDVAKTGSAKLSKDVSFAFVLSFTSWIGALFIFNHIINNLPGTKFSGLRINPAETSEYWQDHKMETRAMETARERFRNAAHKRDHYFTTNGGNITFRNGPHFKEEPIAVSNKTGGRCKSIW